MAIKKFYNIQYPTYPSSSLNPLQGVALPSYPSLPYTSKAPSYTYWAKGGPPKPKPESVYFNYNDPYEINSIADIIYGTFNKQMRHTKLFGLEEVPILNMLTDTLGLFYRGTVKPILKGQWGAVPMNLLVNLGETSDILSNPVKGLILKGKQGLLNAFGLGGEGRVNYNIETGHLVTNIMVEILVDPLNWITLFGKNIVSSTHKASLGKAIEEATGEAGEAFAEQVGKEVADATYKKIAKQAVNAYLKGDADTLFDAMKRLITGYSTKNLIGLKNVPLPQEVVKALLGAEKMALNWMSVTNLQSFKTVIKSTEALQSALFKIVLNSSGIAPAWWVVKKGLSAVTLATKNRAQSVMKKFTNFDGTPSFTDYDISKEIWNKEYDLYNAVLRLKGEEQLTPEMHAVIMREGVIKDNEFISNIFGKLWYEPEKLLTRLQEYLKRKHKVNSLEEYLDVVKEVNSRTQDVFSDVVKYYEEQVENLKSLLNNAAWEKDEKILIMGKDLVDTLEDTMTKFFPKRFFKGEGLYDKPELKSVDAIVNYISGDLHVKFLNIEAALEGVKRILFENFSPDPNTVYNELTGVYEGWFERTIKPLIDNLHKNIDEAPELLKPIIQDTIETLEKYNESMFYQITQRCEHYQTTGVFESFHFNPRNLIGELLDRFEKLRINFDNMLKKDSETLGIMKDTYKNFKDMMEVGVQKKLMEDIFEVYAKSYNKVLSISPDAVNKLNKLKTDLIEFYEDMPNIFKLILEDTQYRDLRDALVNFYNTDLTDLRSFEEVYYDLQRELAFVSSYIENDKATQSYLKYILQDEPTSALPLSSLRRKILHEPWEEVEKIVVKHYGDNYKHFSDLSQRDITHVYKILQKTHPKEAVAFQKQFNITDVGAIKSIQVNVIDAELLEATRDLKTSLQNIQNSLDLYNPITYVGQKIKVQAAGTLLGFKLEQTYNSIELLSDDVVNSFINDINFHNGLGKGIQELAKLGGNVGIAELDEASMICANIVQAGQNYKTYMDLLNNLARANLSNETRTAFISTIQKSAMKDPGIFLKNFDYYFKQIVDDLEVYRYSVDMIKPLNLEVFKESLKDYIAQYMPGFVQHTAESDIQLLELVIQKELAEHFENPLRRYFISDIETIGGELGAGDILEITVKEYNGKEIFSWKRKITPGEKAVLPQERLLNKFFPGMTKDQQIQAFYKRYADGVTEKELLQAFIKQLKEFGQDGKEIALAYHNGDKFDIPTIIARLNKHSLNTSFFEQIPKLDTFRMLKDKAGYYTLHDVEKNRLYQILYRFADKMADNGSNKLINPSNGDLANNFLQLSELFRIAEKNKKLIFDDFFEVHLVQVLDEMRQVGTRIFGQLQEISRTNKQMQWILLDSSWLETIEAQQLFINYAQTITGLTPIEIVERYGTYLNMSKMLYSLTEGLNYIGFKTVVDFEKILEWFSVKIGDELDPRIAVTYTNIGKTLDRMYKQIQRPEHLELYSEKIQNTLQEWIGLDFRDFLVDINNLKEALTAKFEKINDDLIRGNIDYPKFLELDTALKQDWTLLETKFNSTGLDLYNNLRADKADVRSNWVILQYLYKGYDRKLSQPGIGSALKTHITKLIDNLDPEVRELLDHPEFINKKYVTAGEISALAPPVTRRIDDIFAKPLDYKVALETAQQNAKSMEELGDALDVNKLFRAKTQTFSAALMDAHNMLELYNQKINSLGFVDQIKFKYKYKAYANNLAEQQLFQIITLSPENLQQHMVWKAPWFEFDISEYEHESHILNAFTELLNKTDDLKKLHIKHFRVDNRYYFYLSKEAIVNSFLEQGKMMMTLNGDIIPQLILPDLDIEAAGKLLNDPEMAEALLKTRMAIHRLAGNLNASDSTAIGSVGDLVSKDFYEALYKQLPKEVQDDMPELSWLLSDRFFKRERFNFTNLGSLDMRRLKQPYGYGSIISLYQNSSQSATVYAKTKVQYAQLWYNSGMSINIGWLSKASVEDLTKLFKKHPEYILSALVEDSKLGYKVVPIMINNAKDLATAKRLNAVLMDYQSFSTAFETINYSLHGEGKLNLWNKLIYLYKVGYLFDPGVWLRNLVDSMLKNFNESESFTSTLKAQYDAAKLYAAYNDCVDDIIKMDSVFGRFTNNNVIEYFNSKTYDGIRKLDKATYDFIHAFIMDGPSAGIAGPRWDKYFSYRGEDAATEFMDIWQTILHYTRKTMLPNQQVEQITRLADYIMLADRGLSNAQTYQQIAKTHFNYSLKSDFERGMELIFPFYTFTMRNLEYWTNAVSEHPWIANLYADIMQPIWRFDETDHNELSRNRSLQHQILSGNVPLNNTGLTLKTSPSFMDTLNMYTQPLETIKSRLAAPFQELINTGAQHNVVKLSQWAKDSLNIYEKQGLANEAGFTGMLDQNTNLIPIIGTLYQRYAQMGETYYSRTGNPLTRVFPGIFGATLRYQPYAPKRYPKYSKQRKTYSSSASSKFPKYKSKTYFKRLYSTRFYAKRSYVPNIKYYKNYYNKRPKQYESFYRNHYSKAGYSKMKMRMSPVTSKNLQFKIRDRIKDLHRYYR